MDVAIDPKRVRELLALHGPVARQSHEDWTGPFALPATLAAFYAEAGPVDVTVEGYGNPTFFPSLANLWKHQAGYRWNGLTGEPIGDWPDEWIVVADEGADPYIYSRGDGTILYAQHGMGTWDAEQRYPDVFVMAACIATLGAVVLDAGRDFTDEDSIIRPTHRADAIERLTALLGDVAEARVIVGTAGWG